MRTRVLRRPIVFLRVHCSICVRCSITILLIKTVLCSIRSLQQTPLYLYLGAFAKLRKAIVSFLISVRPSYCAYLCRREQLGSHWTDVHRILYLRIFPKPVEEMYVWLKYDKNNGYFTWRLTHICDNISLNSQSEKCCRKICTENQSTYFYVQ
jgi:hypothetical protein